MPDAATRISASSAPNAGVGRSVSRSTSGLPGAVISIALTSAPSVSLVRDRRREFARWRVAVEQRLHRQLDAALLVGLEDLDANDLAFLQVVGDLLDALVRDLADVEQAVLAGQQVDQRAEVEDLGDRAFVDLADFDLGGDLLDALLRELGLLGVGRGDRDRAVFAD